MIFFLEMKDDGENGLMILWSMRSHLMLIVLYRKLLTLLNGFQ